MQSILQRCGRMSTEDEQCHADFIPCKRGWRFYFTPQPRINLCLSLVQGKLSNTNSLQLSFSTTMIFEHHVVSNWLILSNTLPIKGFLKARWWPMEKLFKLDRQFTFFMWLNLVKSIRLPTYPREESSHYIVQQIFFFFFYDFFLDHFLVIFLFCFFIDTLLKVMERHHVPLQHCSG